MNHLVWIVSLFAIAACPPPQRGGSTTGGGGGTSGGGGGGASAAVDPDACGQINTSAAGHKVYAFLVASAELDRASTELEDSVHEACRKMALDLEVSPEGTTKELCARAAAELEANFQVSVKTEKKMVTQYTPAVCHTDVSLTAGFVAECEASAAADADVRCNGTCNGTCSGTCSTPGAGGQCAGTCDGRCNGQCEGFADVHASTECQAAAEVHATTHTQCTEPKVSVVMKDVTVVDATKFQKANAAIADGLPALLRTQKRVELATKALERWGETGGALVESATGLVAQLGAKSLCVANQISGLYSASATIQARFTVSIEASAQVSASAGASAQ
jgi:hypothetical protein